MEFTSKNSYESNEPNNGSEKKTRKKSTKKRIHAPVPVDTLAIENLHADEVHKKKRKRKSASKTGEKALKTAVVSEESVKPHKKIEEAKSSKKSEESNDNIAPESSLETADNQVTQTKESQEPSSSSASRPEKRDSHTAMEHEEVIVPLSGTEEDEGTLFVSERLRNASGEVDTDEQDPETSEPTENESLEVETEEVKEDESNVENKEDDNKPQATKSSSKTRRGATTNAGTSSRATGSGASGGSVAAAAATAAAGAGAASSRRAAVSSGGGNTPPAPPIPPYTNGNTAPSSPVNPLSNLNVAPAAAAVPFLRRNQSPNAVYRRNRYGFIQGVLVGGLIEHIRHKRREKRMNKEHNADVKKADNEIKQVAFEKTELEKKIEQLKNQSKVEKSKSIATEKTLQDTEKKVTTLTEEKNNEVNKTKVLESQEVNLVNRQTFSSEDLKNNQAPSRSLENRPKQEIEAEERKKKEALSQPVAEEVLKVPDNHRIEQSAWHSIEVDKKTGKLAENQSFQYGEEFKNEQHQETLRKQIADMSVESEKVKENYLSQAAVPKQASPGDVASQNPLNSQPVEAPGPVPKPAPSIKNMPQRVQQKSSSIEPIDVAMWVALFIVIGLIIVLL